MPRRPWLLFAALALASCLFGVATPTARASPPCWQRVVADWSDDGRLDGVYPLHCYRDAITHMPEDLRTYSSAPDDIQRALMERRLDRTPARSGAAPLATATAAAVDPRGAFATAGAPKLVPVLAGLLVAVGLAAWLYSTRRE